MMAGARFLGFFVLAFAACAPKPQSISHKVVVPISGPSKNDVDLGVNGRQPTAPLDWSEEVAPTDVFRLSENLFALNDVLEQKDRARWASALIASLPQTPSRIVDSPYTALMTSEAQKMADETLSRVLPELRATPKKVLRVVQGVKFPLARGENLTLAEVARRLFRYLHSVDDAIASSGVMKEVIEGIHEELGKLLGLEARVGAAVKQVESARTLAKALSDVEVVAREFHLSIPRSSMGQLRSGRAIAAQIDAIRDPRSALNSLVAIWIYMTPSQRATYFRAASPDLYDYLNGQSADDLRCLRSPDCLSLPQWIARTLVIQPKIEEYGVDRIRETLNTRSADEVRKQLLRVVIAEIREVPRTVSERLKRGIEKQIEPVLRLQGQFASEMRMRLDKWARKNIESKHPSVVNPRFRKAQLKVTPSGAVRLRWSSRSSAETFEAKAAFASMAPVFWDTDGVDESNARGLALSAIGDLTQQYQRKSSPVVEAPDVTAVAFAETVRGLAGLARSFREWQPSAFDRLLGFITAKDLFPEFETAALKKSIFPKGAFYALSFHGLAEILSSATGPNTPIFLVDNENRVLRANREISEEDVPAVMAGIADRVGNELAPRVSVEGVARYLIAMCEVYAATDGVERSTSEILNKPDENGKVPREEIIQGRARIKLLVLGLANYLSHQFRSGGELVRHELDLATQKPTSIQVHVLDQALAIRALIAASDVIGKDIYYWEAIDLLYSMNRSMYRRTLGFYGRDDEKSVSPVTLLETMRALEAAMPHLPDGSRQQIVNLMAPWREKIAQWRLDAREFTESE